MINKQLLDYISYKLAHGSSIEAIEQKLMSEGSWTATDIREAFIALGRSIPENKKPLVAAPIVAPAATAMPIQKPPAPVQSPVIVPSPKPFVPVTPPATAPAAPKAQYTAVPIVAVPTPKPPAPQYSPSTVQSSQPIASFPKPPPATFAPQYQANPIPTPQPVSTFSAPISTPPTPPSRTFAPSPSFSSLPLTAASKAFVVPTTASTGRRSGVLVVVIILIVFVFIGAGGYIYVYQQDMVQSIIQKITGNYSSSTSTAVTNVPPAPLKSKPSIVDNELYTFTLPRGWKPTAVSNGGRGVQASSTVAGYVVSVAVTPIPDTAGKIDSVDQVITADNVETIIESEFAGAVLGKVSTSTLGGEKAAVIAFTVAINSTGNTSGQPAKAAILQYSAVHGGTLYSVVFKSSLDKGLSLLKDAESIVASFSFK